MLKKHSKASKLLTVFIALTFLVSMTGSAFAATVHVGSVGFETDMLDNDLAYLEGFQSYLAGHANDPIIVNAGSGFVYDANAFSNAPEGTSIGDFVADNPVENPPSGNIWDGTGTPGETQPIEADLTAYNAALAAVTEADYTAESWAAYQAIVAVNVVTAANTQEEVDAAAAAITAAQANLVVKPVALAVESVSAIEAITVTVGDDVVLPETVEVTLNDGNEEEEIEATVVEVAVDWEEFVAEEAGEFDVNGTIVLDEDAEFTISEELAAVTVTVVVEEAALEVVEVSAINAKALKVNFNNAISEEDQAKATFDVKRGTIATTVEATWAEDGKSVELARATNLLAGDYTVTVAGLEFAEGANVGTVKVEAQKIAKLEIATDNVIIDAAAKLEYKVYDQYGEELTRNANTFNWSVVNTTDASRTVAATAGAVTHVTLATNAAPVKLGDVLRITGLLASDPTVKAVKDVTVSNVFVNSFELGEVVLPKDATMLVQNAGYVEVKYEAVDNYGNDIKLSTVANNANKDNTDGIQFITSDATIIPVADGANNFKVTNGKLEVKVLNKSGEVTLTALNTNTGETSSIKIKVNATAAPATVEFGDFKDGAEIVAGDTDGTAKLGITFFDQYGQAIKNDTYNMTTDFNVTVTGAGTLTVTNALAGGYMVFTDSGAAAGTYTITLVHTTTGASASTQVTVHAARVPSELKVKTAPDASVAASGSTDVEFEVKDQYGKDVAVGKLGAYLIKAASANSKVTPPANIAAASANYKVSIAGSAEGADVVTFTLEDGSSKVIDSVSFNIDVVADLATLDVSTDKTEYTAGNDITVTIKAEKAGTVAHTTFNKSGVATITVGSKTYLRTVTFVNGVATTTVPATKAGASVTVNATFDSKTDASAPNVKVVEAAASKFVLTGTNLAKTLDIELYDDYANKITTFEGDKLVKVTYPATTDIETSGIDAEGNAEVTFTSGKGTITFKNNLLDGDYTVTFEGYTGTLTVK